MKMVHQKHCFKKNEKIAGNPCMNCGACCVVFRASFYWTEGDDITEGGVPVHLTEQVNAFRIAMRKIDSQDKRCVALQGVPGQNVRCTIYKRRPSVCRNFEPSWKAGSNNPLCGRARSLLGFDPPSQDFQTGSRAAKQATEYYPIFYPACGQRCTSFLRGYRRSFQDRPDLYEYVRYPDPCADMIV